jgi:hypothetical protein
MSAAVAHVRRALEQKALFFCELWAHLIAFFTGATGQPGTPGIAAQSVYGAIQPVNAFVRDTPESACDAENTMFSDFFGNGGGILGQKVGDLSEGLPLAETDFNSAAIIQR